MFFCQGKVFAYKRDTLMLSIQRLLMALSLSLEIISPLPHQKNLKNQSFDYKTLTLAGWGKKSVVCFFMDNSYYCGLEGGGNG